MERDVKIFENIDQLSQAAAIYVSETISQAVRNRGRALVALSGGSTPEHLFQLLSAAPFEAQLRREDVHFFWCDERCVPPDHPQSNFGQANRLLFQPLRLPESHLHRVRGEIALEEAARAYTDTLRLFRHPKLDWPSFDLVLLGLGADGHTASLFPHIPIPPHQPVLAVSADYEGRPAQRVTLTPAVFNSARRVLFMVSGRNKASAVKHTLSSLHNPLQYPAQQIQPEHGMVTWYLDAFAARELSKGDTQTG